MGTNSIFIPYHQGTLPDRQALRLRRVKLEPNGLRTGQKKGLLDTACRVLAVGNRISWAKAGTHPDWAVFYLPTGGGPAGSRCQSLVVVVKTEWQRLPP